MLVEKYPFKFLFYSLEQKNPSFIHLLGLTLYGGQYWEVIHYRDGSFYNALLLGGG